jgi:hypothetical protein
LLGGRFKDDEVVAQTVHFRELEKHARRIAQRAGSYYG